MKRLFLFKSFNSKHLLAFGACLFFLLTTANNTFGQGDTGIKKEYDVKSKNLKTNWQAIDSDMEIQVIEITQEMDYMAESDTIRVYKNASRSNKVTSKLYRLKANELEKIEPCLVQHSLYGENYVDYNSVVTLMFKTIQEQEKRIAELEKIIKTK